jgi:hypothetical protein
LNEIINVLLTSSSKVSGNGINISSELVVVAAGSFVFVLDDLGVFEAFSAVNGDINELSSGWSSIFLIIL